MNPVNTSPILTGNAFVVMGVSGSGKTTLASLIAEAMDAQFHDADDYHDALSIEKMRAGIPLTDDDRLPWLARLNGLLQTHVSNGQNVVLACSALKASYRAAILRDITSARLVFLDGDYQTIAARIRERSAVTNHYMPESLLVSQFEALERPEDAIIVDVALPSQAQLACVMASIERRLDVI